MFRDMTLDRRRMLGILFFINFFNYLDRQIIFPLFAHIKVDFALSDYQLGLLGTVFILVFSLTSIPFGFLADRYSRKLIIALGVLFWSVATFVSGLSRSFRGLLISRSLVGMGEASYNPAASAMMADNYPYQDRARVQGLFYVGAFLGGTIGTMLGGLIVYYTNNWRLAFMLGAVPGIILAILALTLKDKRVSTEHSSFSIKPLLNNWPYIFILISGTFSSFASGAYLSWGVEYVHRYTTYNLRDSSLIMGAVMLLAGLIGILAGSHLADAWQRRAPEGRSMLVALAAIAATPLLLQGFSTTGTGITFFIYFGLGIVLMCFYLGPAAAVLHDVTRPAIRASAFAFYLFVTHILGDTLSPAFVGWLSDIRDLRVSLIYATFGVALSGVAFFGTAYFIKYKKFPLHTE